MKQSLAKFVDTKTKLKQMVAYLDDVIITENDDDFDWDDVLDVISDRYFWVQNDIQNLYQIFWNHLEGHLPAINSATQMENVLKTLGLDGDYTVQKETIYASDTGKKVTDRFILERPAK